MNFIVNLLANWSTYFKCYIFGCKYLYINSKLYIKREMTNIPLYFLRTLVGSMDPTAPWLRPCI